MQARLSGLASRGRRLASWRLAGPGSKDRHKKKGASGPPSANAEPREASRELERHARAEEEAARIEEANRLPERRAARAGDEILIADRVLVVQDVEDVDEELGADVHEPALVLRAQVELRPAPDSGAIRSRPT